LNAHYDITVLSRVWRSPLLPPFLWIAYLVAPVRGWGWLEGRPLHLVSSVALAAVCWLWAGPGRERHVRPVHAIVLSAALLAKLALGMTLLVPRGFEARYYDNPRFEGPVQPSAEPRDASFTRVDRRLRFGVDGAPDVPVGFFNELRFGFFRDTDPKREGLPFSIRWQGLWRVPSAGRQRLYVHSPGGGVTLTIGDAVSEPIAATDTWTGEVDLPRGFHRVMIEWSVPQDAVRRFEAGRIVDGGRHQSGERAADRRSRARK